MKLNKKAVAGVGLGALALVGGTFAYYNQTATLDNPLRTGHYENEVIEDYTPPTDEVKPGATIDKKVGAKNTGDYPVVVRIKMEEQWLKTIFNNDGVATDTSPISNTKAGDSKNFKTTFNIQDSAKTTEVLKDADGNIIYEEGTTTPKTVELWKATQGNGATGADSDGLTANDETVVRKNMAENYENKWKFNPADGYWYYADILQGGEETTIDLLESLSIASNIDLGNYGNEYGYYVGAKGLDKEKIGKKKVNADGQEIDEEEYPGSRWYKYTVNEKGKSITINEAPDGVTAPITLALNNNGDKNNDGVIDEIDMAKYLNVDSTKALYRRNESKLGTDTGYADANYTLTIKSQFVQATPDAVLDAFFAGDDGNLDSTKLGEGFTWYDDVFNGYDFNAN